jgi:hypothetical protein
MKSVGSKAPVEQQPAQQPDDLSIPDFLRRYIPTPPPVQCVETRQLSAPAPGLN